MKFDILLSTMNNQINLDSLKGYNYTIINQITENLLPIEKEKVYSFFDKGLSKSRNKAIELSNADICLITDNDVEFVKNVDKLILNTFNKNPDADIITFQILTPEGNYYKKYLKKSFWHNKRSIMKVSSIEIAFRRKKILEKDIKFDENFGLGTEFPTGEEVIFLNEAIKKGLKVKYVPLPIVIHPQESSGKNYNSKILIQAKGAMFYKIFGNYSYFVSLIFSVKKAYLSANYNIKEFFKLMIEGIKLYKRINYGK